MVTIEPELRCPAPRHTRLRTGSRFRFAVLLSLFLMLGGLPLLQVVREIRAFQMLQQEGLPVEGTVRRRVDAALFPGVRVYALNCVYTGPAGKSETAALAVDRKWWLASPPGSRVTMTTCEGVPGYATLGEPSDMQLSTELGLPGSGLLLIGLTALLIFGSRLRPYFRDIALVSLGTPVSGRVVGKTWKVFRRLGRQVTLPMIHLHFRDPFGVERVRTQVVDSGTWARTAEGESMTVLVCARRRGWYAAYPLLLAEAVSLRGKCPAALRSKPLI